MKMKEITKSRNQREGGYLGRYISVYDAEPTERLKRRHHRKGRWYWPTLRELRGVVV
jgi:hypothetical protein